MTPPEIDPDDEEALPAPRRPSTRYRPPGFPPEVALIVAGGGDFSDFKQICDALDLAAPRSKANTLRHLGRPGCQQLAGRWSLDKPATTRGFWRYRTKKSPN